MKIANKINLSFFITVVVLVGVLMFTFYAIAKTNLEKAIYAHLSTTAQSRAHHIGTYLEENKARLELLTESGLIEDNVKEIIHNHPNSKESLQNLGLILKDFAKAEKEAYELFILNPDGKVIASTNERHVGADESGEAHFLGGKDEVYIREAHYSDYTKSEEPEYSISAPIRDDNTKELLGILVGKFRMTYLNKITTDRTGLGETGEIYLVNKYGYMITPSRFKEDTFLKQKVDTVNFRNCLSMAEHPDMHMGHKSVFVFPDYRGVMVLGTHEYIPEVHWSLLAKIDEKEAMAPLAAMKLIFIIIFCTIPAMVWTVGILVSRAITAPIHRLHRGTEIIGEGDLDYKVGTDAKDEIGQLSQAFDKMTDDLKGTTTSIENLNKEIAEHMKTELKKDELIKKVDNINKELKEFASIVSHDLKAPLRGIKTLAGWILSDCADKLGDEANKQMNLLLERVERMYNLIEGALQYSRASRVEEKQVQINLNNFLPEIIDMVVPPENITVTIENELPVIECEETHIMQVFQNLLSNAIKYMDKPQGWIKIVCVEQDGFWKFSVADNGPGIEEKHFERIFKIFHALPTSSDFQGTGVGLTVAKKIVELYDGRIWVESKPGEGSTFFFTLPKSGVLQGVCTEAAS